MNRPGPVLKIEYLTWDHSTWTAQLETVHYEFITNDMKVAGGPDFIHTAEPSQSTHQDKWIPYLTIDGSPCMSKCRSHINLGGDVSFDFEHHDAQSGSDRQSDGIVFLAWDGTAWLATVQPISATDMKFYKDAQPIFSLQPLPAASGTDHAKKPL